MPDDQATADALRDRVDELERRVAELQRSGDVGRRRVLATLAGAAGLGAAGVHLGTAPAAAQAAGQVGTASDPVDVFGYNVQAENGVETPSLTDTDTGTTYDIGTFTEGEVLSDQDGDGVYTLPSGSVGIDVPEVRTGDLTVGEDKSDYHLAKDGEITDSGVSQAQYEFTQDFTRAIIEINDLDGSPTTTGDEIIVRIDNDANSNYTQVSTDATISSTTRFNIQSAVTNGVVGSIVIYPSTGRLSRVNFDLAQFDATAPVANYGYYDGFIGQNSTIEFETTGSQTIGINAEVFVR